MTAERSEGRLAGKRVLLTGTGGGQGEAAQALFAAEGASVVGCDLLKGAAERSAKELADRGFDVLGQTVDLGDHQEARAWVEQGVEQLGGLDVLYNNAGKPIFSPFAEMTIDQWNFTIRNELDLIFHVTSPAWSALLEGGGTIINTGSVAAIQGVGTLGQAAHSAAKGGVVALTRQLAAEGAPHGVRANSISPGFVKSPGTSVVPQAVIDFMVKGQQMLHHPATPHDIAQLALFLASDASSFVTGSNYEIDGGWAAGVAA